LKVVNTYQEAKNVIRDGKVLVDGVVRHSPDFPIGLMNVLELPTLKKIFRMLPAKGSILTPLEILESEKNLKLCEITSKTSVKGGKIQYGFHDGRSILAESETDLNIDDVCLLEIPSQKIIRVVSLKQGVLALAVKGRRAGKIGKVNEIKIGTFSKHKMVDIEIDGIVTELPAHMVIAIGDKEPLVTMAGVA
jgi:small subunit ribosomal protein S4e